MTDFDKVVIPLLDEDILPSDIDEQFVGCFTEDLDHPTDMPIIYMLFKCDKVTQILSTVSIVLRSVRTYIRLDTK